MKELVIISGKGGTGKTSLTAALASLASNAVFADCDVDAADLHLILAPKINQTHDFISGREAIIDNDTCSGCDICRDYCRFDAIIRDPQTNQYFVDPAACEGCGVCVNFCPLACIEFPQRVCGQWFNSTTRFGPMVDARLAIAAENSGKLVSQVRSEARKIALDCNAQLLLIDGPPGIGCPVIASITGADHLLLITEPSQSGKHDLERVLQLAEHFSLSVSVCVNRWDINPQISNEIEQLAATYGANLAGRISYDKSITQAQLAGKSVIEFGHSTAANEIRHIWEKLQRSLF